MEISPEEFAPYIAKGAEQVAKEVKIEGFRPGKAPYEILKQKIGEMTILEEAAKLAINKTADEAIGQNTMERQAVGQPQISITKLAPNNPLEYKIIVSILPTVALGTYKGLEIKTEEAKIDEKELEKTMRELQEMKAKESVSENPAVDGDKIALDVHIFLDKVPVEDGHHHDLAIIIGKDYFVPGFDKNLLGLKKGEEKKFSLPYPADHHQKNLAGKMVDFEVKIKEVYKREIPELDDEIAKAFRFKDVADLKKNLSDTLLAEKKRNLELKEEAQMISKIVEATKFGDLPEVIINSEVRNIMSELEQSITRQGGRFEDYLQSIKKSREELSLELTPNAVKRVKAALVIRELAIIEKIGATEDEIQKKMEELKKQYAGNEEVEKMIKEPGYHHYLGNILTNEKVIAKLKEWNYAGSGDKQKS